MCIVYRSSLFLFLWSHTISPRALPRRTCRRLASQRPLPPSRGPHNLHNGHSFKSRACRTAEQCRDTCARSPCGVVSTPHVIGRRTTRSLVVKAAAAELPVACPQPEQGMLAWVATTFAGLFALGAVARPSQQPISNNANIVVIMTI